MQVVNNIVIPAKGIGYADYGTIIGGQLAGVQLQPDWQTAQGKQKLFSVSAHTVPTNSPGGVDRVTTLYTVPSGKNLYIVQMSISNQLVPYASPPVSYLGCIGYIIDVTTGITLFTLGGLASGNIPMNQPIPLPGSHQLAFTVVNNIQPAGSGMLTMSQFTAAVPVTVGQMQVYSRVASLVKVGLYSDSGGEPNIPLATSQLATVIPGWNVIALTMPVALTGAVNYWLAYNATTVGGVENYLAAGKRRSKFFLFADALPNPAGSSYTVDITHIDSIETADKMTLGAIDTVAIDHSATSGIIRWWPAVAAFNLNVTAIKLYMAIGCSLYIGIYDLAGALLATSAEIASIAGWNHIVFPSLALTATTSYYIVTNINGPGNEIYESSGGAVGGCKVTAYGPLPANLPAPSGASVYPSTIAFFGLGVGVLGTNIAGALDNDIGQNTLTEGTLVGYEI